MNRPDRQPLDLDTIEARAKSSYLWIDALQDNGIEFGGEVRHVTRGRGASITLAAPVANWLRDHRADHDALIAEVKRLREEVADQEALRIAARASRRWSRTLDLLAQAEQSDPLDENDYRDRVVGDNVRLVRHGPRHWHPAPYQPCCRCPLSDPSLSFWARSSIGPLTFADTPQHTQEAQNRTQTALQHAALADIAEAAEKLSQAICDWLDLKENQ